MDDVDEIPGSVTLQPKSDMSFNMELDSRRKLQNEQRHEMAENGYKRTRHPFSGYKQLLNYDLTMPRPKMVKRLGPLDDHTVMDVDTNAPGSVEMTGGSSDVQVFVPAFPHPIQEPYQEAMRRRNANKAKFIADFGTRIWMDLTPTKQSDVEKGKPISIGEEKNTTVKSNQGVIYPYPNLGDTSNVQKSTANLEAYKSQLGKPDPGSGQVLSLVKKGVY